jgi:hypothetical protein
MSEQTPTIGDIVERPEMAEILELLDAIDKARESLEQAMTALADLYEHTMTEAAHGMREIAAELEGLTP